MPSLRGRPLPVTTRGWGALQRLALVAHRERGRSRSFPRPLAELLACAQQPSLTPPCLPPTPSWESWEPRHGQVTKARHRPR